MERWERLFERAAVHGVTVEGIRQALAERRERAEHERGHEHEHE